MLDEKIKATCEAVGATEPPTIFFTDSEHLARHQRRLFVPNFRNTVAQEKSYKGNRKADKPFHYYNLLHTMLATYDCVVARDGLEADDALGIAQDKEGGSTIICSRDKDLRMVPGWHYSWPCGKQLAIGPFHSGKWGELRYHDRENTEGKVSKKLIGYGQKFLLFQLLTGDTVDNIPGLKGVGEKKAYGLLEHINSFSEGYSSVYREYEKQRKGDAYYFFKEQGDLLFIRQHEGEDFMTYCKKELRWEDE